MVFLETIGEFAKRAKMKKNEPIGIDLNIRFNKLGTINGRGK